MHVPHVCMYYDGIYAFISHSTKREPLGRAYERGQRMPEGLGTQLGFPGNKTDVKVCA